MSRQPNIRTDQPLAVDAIGAQGDGLATSQNVRVYIPFAAPGDRLYIKAERRRGDGVEASITSILEPSPDRVTPSCRHFKTCGGCALQHVSGERIALEKKAILKQALSRRGFDDAPVADMLTVPPGSRRRVRFALHRGKVSAFGFHLRRSRMVLDIEECPVARPALVALAAPLRELTRNISSLGGGAVVSLTECNSGLDLLFTPTKPKEPSFEERLLLAAFAEKHNLARLSWDDGVGPEPIAARRDATMTFGDVTVSIPPGAFLQPTAEGESQISRIAREAITSVRGKRCADLFSGCGALGFSMLAGKTSIRTVHAFEGDATMVNAARRSQRLAPKATDGRAVKKSGSLTAEVRDLARMPLDADALNRYDAVVFDPPRAGADAQSAELALSRVPTIIAVSCNPSTLARDLRTLVNGGYRLEQITPIDQFAWSPHVEAVAVLRR